MASSSKPRLEPETPEEIMARKRMITHGTHAGNLMRMDPGTEIMMNRDGSNGFRINDSGDPSSIFKWNEKTGDYRSNGGGIANIAEIPTMAAASSSGGGGSSAQAPSDWRESVRKTDNAPTEEGATTADILGDTYESMTSYTPQVGALNPLVDPNQWMTQVNPAYQVAYTDPGVYVNPQATGMLESFSQTSNNPYSLLG